LNIPALHVEFQRYPPVRIAMVSLATWTAGGCSCDGLHLNIGEYWDRSHFDLVALTLEETSRLQNVAIYTKKKFRVEKEVSQLEECGGMRTPLGTPLGTLICND
jgi:hypothetical protein